MPAVLGSLQQRAKPLQIKGPPTESAAPPPIVESENGPRSEHVHHPAFCSCPPRRRPSRRMPVNGVSVESSGHIIGVSEGDYDWSCQYCGAMNWYGERPKEYTNSRTPQYHKCHGREKSLIFCYICFDLSLNSRLSAEFLDE
ncbi:hypothetical protein Tco_1255408 [Tanacetum coccineum]